MKKGFALTDAELMEYGELHISYEIEMLIWTAGLLMGGAATHQANHVAWAMHNAVMNSFAIHSRNLIDFLYSRSLEKDRPSDIIIQDFIAEDLLSDILPVISPLLLEAKIKADKQVAHLSLERRQFEIQGKQWRFAEIAVEIMTALHIVGSRLPETKIGERLRTLLSRKNVFVPKISFRAQIQAVTIDWDQN